jgi:Tfp pilus assembly protein PilN
MIPDINLLPKIERRTTANKLAILISVVISALILAFLAFHNSALTKSIKTLESQQQLLNAEKIELQEKLTALDGPKEMNLDESVEFIESVSYPVSPLLIEINKFMQPGARISNYSFSETTVNFSLDFKTMADIASYIEQLSESAYFTDVKLDQMSTNDTSEGYSNTFTATIDPYYLQTGGVER